MAHATRQWGFGGTNRVYQSPISIWPPDHIGQKNRLWKIFYHDFWSKKYDFLNFFSNIAILRRWVNIGFPGAFRASKGQFPAKYHISGHHTKKYRLFKNRIFCDFLRFFRFWPIWLVAGIGRKWPEHPKIFKNVFLRLFRSVFMPIACTYDI